MNILKDLIKPRMEGIVEENGSSSVDPLSGSHSSSSEQSNTQSTAAVLTTNIVPIQTNVSYLLNLPENYVILNTNYLKIL